MSATAAATEPAAKRFKGRKQFTRKQRFIATIINLTLFCFAWEFGVQLFEIKPIILPQFSAVVAEIPEMHEEGILVSNVLFSLRIYMTGMLLSIALSIPLGLLLGGVKILDRIISYWSLIVVGLPLYILHVRRDVAPVVHPGPASP